MSFSLVLRFYFCVLLAAAAAAFLFLRLLCVPFIRNCLKWLSVCRSLLVRKSLRHDVLCVLLLNRILRTIRSLRYALLFDIVFLNFSLLLLFRFFIFI